MDLRQGVLVNPTDQVIARCSRLQVGQAVEISSGSQRIRQQQRGSFSVLQAVQVVAPQSPENTNSQDENNESAGIPSADTPLPIDDAGSSRLPQPPSTRRAIRAPPARHAIRAPLPRNAMPSAPSEDSEAETEGLRKRRRAHRDSELLAAGTELSGRRPPEASCSLVPYSQSSSNSGNDSITGSLVPYTNSGSPNGTPTAAMDMEGVENTVVSQTPSPPLQILDTQHTASTDQLAFAIRGQRR